MICSKCNTLNSNDAEVCVGCGAPLKRKIGFEKASTELHNFRENILGESENIVIDTPKVDTVQFDNPVVPEFKEDNVEKKEESQIEISEEIEDYEKPKKDYFKVFKNIGAYFSKLRLPSFKFDFFTDFNRDTGWLLLLSVGMIVLVLLLNFKIIGFNAIDNFLSKTIFISENIVKKNIVPVYVDSVQVAYLDSLRKAQIADSLQQLEFKKKKEIIKKRSVVKKRIKKKKRTKKKGIIRHKRNMQIYISEKDNMKMILIPSSSVIIGSNKESINEKPEHNVFIQSFYIDEHEVTNAQYRRFVESTSSKLPKYVNNNLFNAPNQPVVGISYEDAENYAKWAGKRLPTEKEWEKAARGGLKKLLYPFSQKITPRFACYDLDPNKDSAVDVKKYAANDYLLYDMSGNVAEWTSSLPNAYKGGTFTKKFGTINLYRIIRGGSWRDIKDYISVSHRGIAGTVSKRNDIGFRCVMDN